MPRGDMTGPPGGSGRGTGGGGRGMGGGGRGMGGGGRGMGAGGGRMGGNRPGAGPGGDCVCPQCGEKVAHQAGTPCYNIKCPKCGTAMVRS
ncbi:MAG: hypothetical protein JXA01_09585 [Dehalococcoidia bacterium]|nr:hypothetical protein [Dehalococcoidia bacterium]